MKKIGRIIAASALAFAVAIPTATAFADSPLPNGYTAAVVAQSGQTISGTIDATNYDVGIYIGPGIHDVKVDKATVSGAHDEGILVQDASNVLIENSTITNNAVSPFTADAEDKGIVLAGTTNVLVKHNTVTSNNLGGIGIYDDGPNSVFAPTAINTTTSIAGTGNVILDNLVKDNLGGCGIVVAAKNPGGGVSNNVVSGNTVLGFDPATGDTVPGVGGIVVAGGEFGAVSTTNNVVSKNVITGGFIPGISLHASGQGVISGTQLIGNSLSQNDLGQPADQTNGIEIIAGNGGTIVGTQVLHDQVSGDYFGVFHAGDTGTHIAQLKTNDVTIPVGSPP